MKFKFKSAIRGGLAFCGMLALLGCGKNGSAIPPEDPTLKMNGGESTLDAIPMSSLQASINAAHNGKLFCGNQAECNPAVAMISIVTHQGITRCSGVLISDDEVMTNDHCLSDSYAVKMNLSCENLIFSHFVSGAFNQGVTANCASITYRSRQSGTDSADYAIIKLKEKVTDRKPAQPARRGFKFHETAILNRVQMLDEGYNGRQEQLRCMTTYQTMLYPEVVDGNFPLMTFGNCPIVKGNSGSPVFNENGELGAIAQGFINLMNRPDLNQQMRALQLDVTLANVAVGTQVACMSEVLGASALACSPIQKARGLEPFVYMNRYRDYFTTRLALPETTLLWKKTSLSNERMVHWVEVPECSGNHSLAIGAKTSLRSVHYILGINQNFEMEWRALNTESPKQSFAVTALSDSEMTLSSPLSGEIKLPFCNSGNTF